jgi:hypothetical protein
LNARLRHGFSDEEMAIVGRWLESVVENFSAENLGKHDE